MSISAGELTMEFRLLNLDIESDVVIVVTYNEKTRSVTKSELIQLLESSETKVIPQPKPGRTLASLGKIIGLIRRDRTYGLTGDDCQRLMAAIQTFDGNVANKRSSQVGRWLREISTLESASEDLKTIIKSFLDRYPQLEAIPKRKA